MTEPEQPQVSQVDLALAAVLVTAAQYAQDQPHQPLQAATPEEVAFLAGHVKPLVECLERDLGCDGVQRMIGWLRGASQTAIVDGLDTQGWLELMDHLGDIRKAGMCLSRAADEASRVAYRLYLDRPQGTAGCEQGGVEQGEPPPAAPSP